MSEVGFRLDLNYICDLIKQKAREVTLIGEARRTSERELSRF